MMPWLFVAKIAAPILLALGVFAWGYSVGDAGKQREWDLATAAQVKAQLAASEQARATETALQAKVKEAQDARQLDKIRNDRIAAGLRADSDRLRSDIAQFAGGASGDTECPATGRAIALGELLDSAVQTAIDCAVRGENDAAIARGLYRGWPVAAPPAP